MLPVECTELGWVMRRFGYTIGNGKTQADTVHDQPVNTNDRKELPASRVAQGDENPPWAARPHLLDQNPQPCFTPLPKYLQV
jgi:hypothetical protein